MNLVRCNNGHFYDGDKFPACPHCTGVQSRAVDESQNVTFAANYSGASMVSEDEPTVAQNAGNYGNPGSSDAGVFRSGLSGQGGSSSSFAGPDFSGFGFAKPVGYEDVTIPSKQAPAFRPVQDDDVTVSHFKKAMGMEPVVGWLVCTKGKYRGQSFQLKSGRNFIGRSSNMDVSLSGDESISREKHAAIIYEPKQCMFLAQAGESRELFYVNDRVVLAACELKSYDKLSLGNTELMFVPCCGEHFSWEDADRAE